MSRPRLKYRCKTQAAETLPPPSALCGHSQLHSFCKAGTREGKFLNTQELWRVFFFARKKNSPKILS